MPTISTIDEGLAYGLWESGERKSMPWPPPAAIKRAATDLKKLYEALNGCVGADTDEA